MYRLTILILLFCYSIYQSADAQSAACAAGERRSCGICLTLRINGLCGNAVCMKKGIDDCNEQDKLLNRCPASLFGPPPKQLLASSGKDKAAQECCVKCCSDEMASSFCSDTGGLEPPEDMVTVPGMPPKLHR
ncbi:hypothetical protein DdX_18738 [Ditylenchus destructor]|uniref:Uncharacterized protein n=1 Tax=Ditylenchus destructor TaxID=166010 RepID=A0AAD4MNY8_9BILA|nr:hypothetical protein DdX_18738 [Ditylenchus destructor]